MNDKLIILCAYMSIHKYCCLVRVNSDSQFLAGLYSTHVTDLSIGL